MNLSLNITNNNTTNNNNELADYDLMCPILLDWLEDPIIMPCCGKAISKLPLYECVKDSNDKKCPNCNKNINNFDILNTPVSLNILNIVKRFKDSNPLFMYDLHKKTFSDKISLDWEGHIDWMEPTSYQPLQTIMGKLKLECLDNKFNFKTLLIPVIDKSGSMNGNPINQCIYSLNRIIDLAYSNPNIITNIITYNDMASSIFVNTLQTIESYKIIIDNIKANDGTSFTVAFNEIVRVCQELIDSTVTNVTIIFLTDGEDSSTNKTNRTKLIDLLKEKLNRVTEKFSSIQTQIHTIGFGASHDYDFLNGLRLISKIEGAYRFADPKEDSDSLSNKINSILDVIKSNSNIPIKIISCPYKIIYSDCPIYWLDLTKSYGKSVEEFDIQIQIGNNNDDTLNNFSNTNIFNVRCKFNDNNDDDNKIVWNEWYTHLIDELMSEVLDLVKKINGKENLITIPIQIHLELIEQRTNAIEIRIKSNIKEEEYEDSIDLMRCDKIRNVIKELRLGNKLDSQINLKLNDLKFEGKFKTTSVSNISNISNVLNSNKLGMKAGGVDLLVHKMDFRIKKKSFWEILPKQKLLQCDKNQNQINITTGLMLETNKSIEWYEKNKLELENYVDLVGFNFFAIACSIGKYGLVKHICLSKSKINDRINDEINNNSSEFIEFIKLINTPVGKELQTPLDLAIRGGYWKTCQILLDYGAKKFSSHAQILLRTCISKNFWKTGEIMIFNGIVSIDDEMLDTVPDSNGLVWLSKMKGAESIDIFKAIKKLMVDVVSKEIDSIKEHISWSDYMELFIKPTKEHIKIIDILLQADKANPLEIIDVIEAGEPEKTTLLYMSCEQGNIDLFFTIIKYIPQTQLLEQINWQNLKGTSCLWIASCNKHVGIVTELLAMGADPNLTNMRGDSPLIPTCQKGSESIVELLLGYGCDLEKFNPDRENAIMVCCRNGQSKLLDIILGYINDNFDKNKLNFWLDWCAKIDGFNPILSSAELGNINCIKIIYKYVPEYLEFRSGFDNKIIKGATPLLLASFYGRIDAVKTLLELGADIMAQTIPDNLNCLHLAISHGHKDLVRYLLNLTNISDSNYKYTEKINKLLEMKDSKGKIPEYYARLSGNEDILEEFFTSKLGKIFSNILISTVQDEIECAYIMQNYGKSTGVYEYSNITQINLSQGTSPLAWALLTGKKYLAEKLIEIGSDIFAKDDRGISPYFWMKYLKINFDNFLLKSSPSELTISDTEYKLHKLELITKANPQYKILLQYVPGMISPNLLEQTNSTDNCLLKMLDGFDIGVSLESLELVTKSNNSSNLMSFIDKLKLNKIILSKSNRVDISNTNSDYWKMMLMDAKINLIKIILSDECILNPNQILALYLYTANLDLFKNVNINLSNLTISSSWYGFISCLYQGLMLLPNYIGECFRAVDLNFDPVKYSLDSIVEWNAFSIACEDWKNSSELIELKRGMIFIIKSKTGKNISKYSKYPQENEIVFVPGIKFKVSNYFVPDIICLAQENIRNTTFKFNSNEKIRGFFDKVLEGKSSIIIELVEI